MDLNISLIQGQQFKNLQNNVQNNANINETYTNKQDNQSYFIQEGFKNHDNKIQTMSEIDTLQKQFNTLLLFSKTVFKLSLPYV